MIQQNIIDPGERKNLIDGAATSFAGGFQYVAGAYSRKSSQYSRGLYLSKFINGRQRFVKYFNYADLSNFFGYMREKREARIKRRIERRKAKGKKNRFNYRLLVHDIIERDETYILIGEAYYPRYSSYGAMNWESTWRTAGSNRQGVIGYRYTHAIVVAFDRNGNILWDHSFSIDDVFTPNLEEFVTVHIHNDRVELVYLEENLIRSKVIEGDEIVEGITYTPVKLGSEKDVLRTRDPEFEGLEHWYENNMYAYGVQRIKHKVNGSAGGERKVFYINKIAYNYK
jgi:hypothetical protein